MARRKKRGKNIVKAIQGFFAGVLHVTIRLVPAVICVALVGGLFLGVRTALYADSNLAVQSIQVSPRHAVSVDKLLLIEKRYLGENILKVNLDSIADELEKDPHIQEAKVLRQFPSDIQVEITKRRPIGLIQFSSGGSYGLISADGMILDVLNGITDSLLVFKSYDTQMSKPRSGVRVLVPGYDQAAEFVQNYWQHPISEQEIIETVLLDRTGNVTVVFKDGPSIRLGRKPVERLQAFDKIVPLLGTQSRKTIDYIDLQYDDIIVKNKR